MRVLARMYTRVCVHFHEVRMRVQVHVHARVYARVLHARACGHTILPLVSAIFFIERLNNTFCTKRTHSIVRNNASVFVILPVPFLRENTFYRMCVVRVAVWEHPLHLPC